MHDEREFYENNEDVVENYDQLNKVNEEDLDLSSVERNNESNYIAAYKNLILPSKQNLECIYTEYVYKQRETDPHQRILNLKEELLSTRTQIEEYVENFKENVFVKETDNFNKVLEDLDLYKNKIDAFINYDIFNNLENYTDGDADDNKNKSNSNSQYNSQSQSSNRGKEFTSLFEKYNRLTENLISQIKVAEGDVINQNNQNLNVKYEIYSNPETQMDNLLHRITELEDLVTNLERSIGNWNIYNNNETISLTLSKLFNFVVSKKDEKYDKKYQTFKECGSLISSFLEKKKEKLETGSYFLKIKELYSVLELYEHFDQLFEYLKKRLKAIKEIYDNSDQFSNLLVNLTNAIKKNEERFQNLVTKYQETMKTFEEFYSVLKEVNEIDNSVKKYLI